MLLEGLAICVIRAQKISKKSNMAFLGTLSFLDRIAGGPQEGDVSAEKTSTGYSSKVKAKDQILFLLKKMLSYI